MNTSLSSFESAFLMINAMMGSGIVFQDKVFKNAGLLYAILIYIISALLTAFSQIFLCFSAKKQKRDNVSYSDICYEGNWFLGILTEIVIFVFLFFVSIFYGSKLKSLLTELNVFSSLLVNLIIALGIILTSLFISIKILKYTSKLSVLGVLVIIFVSGGYFIQRPLENFKSIDLTGDNKMDALKMALFGLCCQFNTLNIYNNLDDRSNMGIFKFTFMSSFGGAILSGLVGLFGIGAFKADPSVDICTYLLINTDTYGQTVGLVAGFAFATVLFTGILGIVFAMCGIVEEFNRVRTKFAINRIFINLLVSVLVALSSLYFNPAKLLNIIAASFISLISLIFPTISYLLIVKKGQFITRGLAAGMFLMGVGLMIYYNLY